VELERELREHLPARERVVHGRPPAQQGDPVAAPIAIAVDQHRDGRVRRAVSFADQNPREKGQIVTGNNLFR
jgi:hypothetical protein